MCAESAIPYPTLFGAEILNLSANLVQNFSQEVSDRFFVHNSAISVRNIDYCNITVTYTHPGQNDRINVETWFPMKNWNRRLQAVGGGGWQAGRFIVSYDAMAGALGKGYVVTSTDAGLGITPTPEPWALKQSRKCKFVCSPEPCFRVFEGSGTYKIRRRAVVAVTNPPF